MRVHLPLEDVYDPLLVYMHWDFCEPPVGFAAPQVEASSDHLVCSLHSSVLVEHCSFLICLMCSYSSGALTPMKTAQNTTRD